MKAGVSTDADSDDEAKKPKEEEEEEEARPEKPKIFEYPHPRFNAALTVQADTLYIYGGTFEKGDREFTFDELWSVNLNHLDGVTRRILKTRKATRMTSLNRQLQRAFQSPLPLLLFTPKILDLKKRFLHLPILFRTHVHSNLYGISTPVRQNSGKILFWRNWRRRARSRRRARRKSRN